MSSLTRRIQRKQARNNGSYAKKPQLTVALEDGGYITLHPTQGWMKVSGKRVAAWKKLAAFRIN